MDNLLDVVWLGPFDLYIPRASQKIKDPFARWDQVLQLPAPGRLGFPDAQGKITEPRLYHGPPAPSVPWKGFSHHVICIICPQMATYSARSGSPDPPWNRTCNATGYLPDTTPGSAVVYQDAGTFFHGAEISA